MKEENDSNPNHHLEPFFQNQLETIAEHYLYASQDLDDQDFTCMLFYFLFFATDICNPCLHRYNQRRSTPQAMLPPINVVNNSLKKGLMPCS